MHTLTHPCLSIYIFICNCRSSSLSFIILFFSAINMVALWFWILSNFCLMEGGDTCKDAIENEYFMLSTTAVFATLQIFECEPLLEELKYVTHDLTFLLFFKYFKGKFPYLLIVLWNNRGSKITSRPYNVVLIRFKLCSRIINVDLVPWAIDPIKQDLLRFYCFSPLDRRFKMYLSTT